MGGYYSSRWHWYEKKRTVDQCSQIKLKEIAKVTLARRFEAEKPVYADDMNSTKQIDRLIDAVLGDLGIKPRTATTHSQGIALTRTACHYGGHRYWLVCPDCGRRCLIVYKIGWHGYYGYACRLCHDLVYASAQEARKPPVRIKTLARNIDLLIRAEKVLQKTDKCRFASKNFWRLVARYEQLMAGVKP